MLCICILLSVIISCTLYKKYPFVTLKAMPTLFVLTVVEKSCDLSDQDLK